MSQWNVSQAPRQENANAPAAPSIVLPGLMRGHFVPADQPPDGVRPGVAHLDDDHPGGQRADAPEESHLHGEREQEADVDECEDAGGEVGRVSARLPIAAHLAQKTSNTPRARAVSSASVQRQVVPYKRPVANHFGQMFAHCSTAAQLLHTSKILPQ